MLLLRKSNRSLFIQLQVALTDDNFIFDLFDGEWMKWTVHANFTARYLFEIKHKATADLINMDILTFVDGVQVLEPYSVVPLANLFVTLGNFTLGNLLISLRYNANSF